MVGFEKRPGRARDIAVGSKLYEPDIDVVWAIGDDLAPGGYALHQWNVDHWEQFANGRIGGVRIAVDALGAPWWVDRNRNIYRLLNGSIEQQAGSAIDIGAGGGTVWVIGTDAAPGGYVIQRYGGSRWWTESPGRAGAVRIDTDNHALPWVVNIDHQIFRLIGNDFSVLPGSALDIAVAGQAWVIGTDPAPGGYGIYRWNEAGRDWEWVPGGATDIAVGPSGNPWVVNDDKLIFEYVPEPYY